MKKNYEKPKNAKTQSGRIIAALKHYGESGITLLAFQAPNVCDNGKPIIRMQTRIHELRAEGWNIVNVSRKENRPKRNCCDVYVLRDGEYARGGIVNITTPIQFHHSETLVTKGAYEETMKSTRSKINAGAF
jgi:hypothetical protein